jgi:hypothetical protein
MPQYEIPPRPTLSQPLPSSVVLIFCGMWEQGHRDSGLMHGSEVTVGKGWREEGRTGRTGVGGGEGAL